MTDAAFDPDDGTLARLAADAPPLTAESRSRLARLLRHGSIPNEGSTQ